MRIKFRLTGLGRIRERLSSLKHHHKFWRKHVLVCFVTVLLCLSTVTFMTGVLHFRNDVSISQNGTTKKFFTMKSETYEILNEFGYVLGEFDRVEHTRQKNGHDFIEVINGFGVEITINSLLGSESFMGSAVTGETAQMILTANEVDWGRYDIISYENNKVEVFRGFPVNVTADSQTLTLGINETEGTTVADILVKSGITLAPDDIINISPGSKVVPGDEIIVKRVTFRDRVDLESVPRETLNEYSNLIAIGEKEVIEGTDGEITVTYREKIVDGEVVSSEVRSREQTKVAEPKIIVEGLALKTPYSKRDFPEIKLENGIPVDYVKKHSGKSTAYTAPPTSGTASGRKLEIGTVAVNPEIIPYGSLLYIVNQNGNRVYGAAIAADTGYFIYMGENAPIVDVFMGLTSENYHEALRWGAQFVDVYVISEGLY
ncbi:MAG: 3D domain-containing protein [Oscillospiraceae bacterium]|nr:3D domain-containing protein [Oscillospiraceae bacterium]